MWLLRNKVNRLEQLVTDEEYEQLRKIGWLRKYHATKMIPKKIIPPKIIEKKEKERKIY